MVREKVSSVVFQIFFCFCLIQGTAGDSSSQTDTNTIVGKPKLDITVGISIGLFVLFLGMAIFVYKPKRKRFPVRTTYSEIGQDQPMPV
ncbi:unnamed protein product [Porites evermanni]|uniref:Uncharacterized protein n=1 Tax=Porites evermanni TaxID=104178 RepID=A0ABN8SXG6_9CNID|nr:unnamed protein product [Porites evermanni]